MRPSSAAAGLRGSHPKAKLTQDQVDEIRASRLPGVVLARQFGVAKSTVTWLRRGPSAALVERRQTRRAEVLAGT
ncbi:hypothetical protein CLBKND_04742 [Methylorubrum aminovorans]